MFLIIWYWKFFFDTIIVGLSIMGFMIILWYCPIPSHMVQTTEIQPFFYNTVYYTGTLNIVCVVCYTHEPNEDKYYTLIHYIRYRSIITSFVHAWQHDHAIINPVTCLHGPRFLVAWDIHASCNLSCATHVCHVWFHALLHTQN